MRLKTKREINNILSATTFIRYPVSPTISAYELIITIIIVDIIESGTFKLYSDEIARDNG